MSMSVALGLKRIVRDAGAAALAAFALAACQSANLGTTTTSENDESLVAASPANIASLSDVVQRNPRDPQAYNMRGSVYGQARRFQEALADFDKAIALDPNYAQAYANRAQIQRQVGKADLALADYDKALSIDPGYAPAYLGRGIVHRQKGRSLDAFNDFNKAISIRPDNSQAYYNRGMLYQSQRDQRDACQRSAGGLDHGNGFNQGMRRTFDDIAGSGKTIARAEAWPRPRRN